MKTKMLIWGTGDWADRFITLLRIQEDEIEGFLESKKSKEVYRGKRVYEAGELKDINYDVIVVASSHTQEIAIEAEKQGISRLKLIFPNRSKIGVVGNYTGKINEYDWFGTENSREWIVFDYGIYTNSHEISEQVKTVLSLAEFWKNKNEFNTLSYIPLTAKKQSELLKKYFIPELSKEDVVCDFACASGEWSELISPYVGQLDGFDCSEKMLETAKKNAEAKKINNISYRYMEAENVKFEGKYDHFLMLGLLTCIEDDATANRIVEVVSDSMKTGGYLAVRDTLCMHEKDKVYYNEKDYSAVFREKGNYEKLYLKNGFELIAEEYLNVYAHKPIEHGSHGYIFRKK